ncbi:MAG: protein kinase [Acidobacteriota bacterium]|nr:protein kinase [Acidobacteriota bacterium]
MGEVYLAEDTRLHRQVALKFLPADVAHDRERLQRFLREARAASVISHPNVAVIHEVGEAEDRSPFIAMEYVEGQTLAEKIGGRPLPLQETLDIATEIAEALDEAHARGVVHRDIKPANIMITARGHAKVLDFGLAKLQSADGDGETDLRSRTGVVMGTLQYMSPEQTAGEKVDHRTDIYSVGAVLYEMATGRRVSHDLEKIASPELERIIRKSLEQNPESRYQSARELLVDLRNMRRDKREPHAVRRWPWIAISAVALLAIAIFVARNWTVARTPIDSLAVLPFINTSRDAQSEFLADGMTETIINKLTELPQLKVMSRSTMFRYKGKNADPQEVGRQLNVRAVLAGRVQQLGDRLNIQTELVKVDDGSQLWGERYERRVADVFATQDDIAREISDKLRLKLTGAEEKRLTKRYTNNPEAYALYVQGRYYWNKRTPASLDNAVALFNQALDHDPNYALAYLGLADTYAILSEYKGTPTLESNKLAKAAAAKALEIDPDLAEAHATLGIIDQNVFDWQGAEKEFKRAIELKPNYATAHHWYGLSLWGQRRFRESLAECRKGQAADPMSQIINTNVANALESNGRLDEAIELLQRTIDMDPRFEVAHTFLGRVYFHKGNGEAGLREFEKSVELTGRAGRPLSFLGYGYARTGRRDEALKIIHELEERLPKHSASPFGIAFVYTGLGDREQAYRWLERGIDEYDQNLMGTSGFEFDAWRSDPRFQQLMRKMNLPVE